MVVTLRSGNRTLWRDEVTELLHPFLLDVFLRSDDQSRKSGWKWRNRARAPSAT